MRLHRPLLALALASLVLISAPASAVESLEEARCVCVDGALNQGDYVSCMAKFTRRLVAAGVIDKVERSNAVSDASREDFDALRESCVPDDDGLLAVGGWGVGLQVGTPFYPAPAPSGVASAAEVSLYLWNFSPQDVLQTTNVAPGGDCGWVVRILNAFGDVIRNDESVCLPSLGSFDVPMGTIEQRDFILPLLAFQAETGLADGTRLPIGDYRVEVSWVANGPNQDDMPSTVGTSPTAAITIRVGS